MYFKKVDNFKPSGRKSVTAGLELNKNTAQNTDTKVVGSIPVQLLFLLSVQILVAQP